MLDDGEKSPFGIPKITSFHIYPLDKGKTYITDMAAGFRLFLHQLKTLNMKIQHNSMPNLGILPHYAKYRNSVNFGPLLYPL